MLTPIDHQTFDLLEFWDDPLRQDIQYTSVKYKHYHVYPVFHCGLFDEALGFCWCRGINFKLNRSNIWRFFFNVNIIFALLLIILISEFLVEDHVIENFDISVKLSDLLQPDLN